MHYYAPFGRETSASLSKAAWEAAAGRVRRKSAAYHIAPNGQVIRQVDALIAEIQPATN